MRIPRATYRIQFNPSFTFNDAKAIVSYLADLGVSDIYASPIFKAKKDSMHGYDVVDPNQLNPQLGTEADFNALLDVARQNSLGWLQDIVPNHMAYDTENAMLMDVLEKGEASPHFGLFDITWDHPYDNMKGRVLAPFLGKFYSEALEDGQIQLCCHDGDLCVKYYQLKFPLSIVSYAQVFEFDIASLEKKLTNSSTEFMSFLGVINSFKNLPSFQDAPDWQEQIKHVKKMFWALYHENQNIREYVDATISLLNGKKGDPDSFNALDHIVSAQLYRLSFWKVAAEEINYRRFFCINGLISLKVEDEAVFNQMHALIFKLCQQGVFTGLRVDHIDGLFDPETYLQRLNLKAKDTYLVVEKILDAKEQMPVSWPVAGTTGYDFMNYCSGLFCKKSNEVAFVRLYYKFTGQPVTYERLLAEKKRLIIGKHMAGNIDNLAQLLKKISAKDRYGRDITLYGLRRALVEVMAFFPVYRSYINGRNFTDTDRTYIKAAIQKAREAHPGLMYEMNFIEKFLLLESLDQASEEDRKQWIYFVMRFQQFTGPLMAKGFEDTLLYSYNRLISLNEVGGYPEIFGFSKEDFFKFIKRRQAAFKHSFNATATHDTKRGEDTRARINVLSEIPKEWGLCLNTWKKINRTKKKKSKAGYIPDANDEYFIYQTLLGTFPFDGLVTDSYKSRIKDYVIKAVREAKVHTAWVKPDAEYEEACLAFIDRILDVSPENAFMVEFLPFVKKISYLGIFNSLSQVLIKILSPGVADFYQGCEFWDLSLVDPDNRRSVDFQKRISTLKDIKDQSVQDMPALMRDLLGHKEDGRIKLFLTLMALKIRKEKPVLFEEGEYVLLEVQGALKDHVFATALIHENDCVVTVIPRFVSDLVKEGGLPCGKDVWTDTAIIFPAELRFSFKDYFTNRVFEDVSKPVFVGDLLEHFCVGLFTVA
ncbi:MAG: malto-oligosyltrehalose synthase [Candidatus Omnitrophota bacterium]